MSALRQAVKAHVPEESRRSVIEAIELILKSKARHDWNGTNLAKKIIPCGIGETLLQPIGLYRSVLHKTPFVLALQPRSEDFPSLEQFKLWHSSLYYGYAVEHDADVLIIDVSKNPINGNRELRELSREKLSILEKRILDRRLGQVAGCYYKALEEVPAQQSSKKGSSGQKEFGF